MIREGVTTLPGISQLVVGGQLGLEPRPSVFLTRSDA